MSEEEVKAKAIEELNKKISSINESQITGFAKKITDNFMSDRQVLKKIISMKSPNLSDDELNLLVYGRDLKRELGASYKAWKSERDAEDEEDDDDDLKPKKDKTKKNKADKDKTKDKTKKNKNKGESEETEKTKREKRKEKKMVFKPIPRDNPLFDEVKKLKSEIKLKFHLLEEKTKNLLSEIMKFGVMVGTTIPAAIVLSAPPSFNIPGAVTLVLNLMNAFSSISSKIEDLLPYLDVANKLNAVIPSDKMTKVSSKLNTFLGMINEITSLFAKFKNLIPKVDPDKKVDGQSLNDIKKDIDNLDKKINSLRVEDFDSQSDYEKEKKRLEKEKEKKSKKAADMLK